MARISFAPAARLHKEIDRINDLLAMLDALPPSDVAYFEEHVLRRDLRRARAEAWRLLVVLDGLDAS